MGSFSLYQHCTFLGSNFMKVSGAQQLRSVGETEYDSTVMQRGPGPPGNTWVCPLIQMEAGARGWGVEAWALKDEELEEKCALLSGRWPQCSSEILVLLRSSERWGQLEPWLPPLGQRGAPKGFSCTVFVGHLFGSFWNLAFWCSCAPDQ